MAVHAALGNGFQEVIYQRALAIEMRLAGIVFSREHEMPIYYREEHIGTRRVDFLRLLINFGEKSLKFKRLTNKKMSEL